MDQMRSTSGVPGGTPQRTPVIDPPGGSSGPIRRVVRVSNPFGVHYRVADRFARAAKNFVATVTVWNGSVRADGKSVMDLILLVALPGVDLILEVDGEDATKALDPLSAILSDPGGEDHHG